MNDDPKDNNGWRGPFPWPVFAENEALQRQVDALRSENQYLAMQVATAKEKA